MTVSSGATLPSPFRSIPTVIASFPPRLARVSASLPVSTETLLGASATFSGRGTPAGEALSPTPSLYFAPTPAFRSDWKSSRSHLTLRSGQKATALDTHGTALPAASNRAAFFASLRTPRFSGTPRVMGAAARSVPCGSSTQIPISSADPGSCERNCGSAGSSAGSLRATGCTIFMAVKLHFVAGSLPSVSVMPARAGRFFGSR